MADANCIFCKIVAGDLPSFKVDEDERTYAFMDINPATPGHLLVVPREHYPDLLAIAVDDLVACTLTAQRLAARAVSTLGADGVNLINATGAEAWQSVFHFHLHVIPRYADQSKDSLRLPWAPQPGDLDAIAAIAAELSV
jgi:histidine triad (HIT) family protein